jgi:hypothetical protein
MSASKYAIWERVKGSVQQDLSWLETGLNKSVQKSYITRKISFGNLKECHHERSIKPVSASSQK